MPPKTKAPVVKKEETHEHIAEQTDGEFPMAMYKGDGAGGVVMKEVKNEDEKAAAIADEFTDHPDDHDWDGTPVKKAVAPRTARVKRVKPSPKPAPAGK